MAIDPPFEAPRTRLSDAAAVLLALIAHVIVFALLSATFLAKPDMVKVNEQPIDVTLTDKIGLVATAPQSAEPPAQSVAPDIGKPEDAAAPAPSATPDTATLPAPKPLTSPSAKPSDNAKPQPAKPAPETPQRQSPTQRRDASLPDPSTFRQPSTGRSGASKDRPRGASLGDDFLKGLSDKPSKTRSQVPHAAVIDAQVLASISDAISRQIQPCADRQSDTGIPAAAKQIVITFNLRLQPDGSLAARPAVVRMRGVDDETQRYAQRIEDIGLAAFKGCSPLKLPPEFYSTPNGGWNNINYNWQLR